MIQRPKFVSGDRVVLIDNNGSRRIEKLWRKQKKGRAKNRWLFEGMGPQGPAVSEELFEKIEE